MRYEMELRNVPLQRIQEYLVEAGGELTGERSVNGDGWSAVLETMEPVKITVMRIPRDKLVIEGDDETAVETVYRFMRRKTMRGGG